LFIPSVDFSKNIIEMSKNLNIEPINNWMKIEKNPLVISGPCSAETYDQLFETCKQLKSYGINLMRAGVWKPRTRPGSFEGNGEEALKWISEIKKELDIKFTVEVANTNHIELLILSLYKRLLMQLKVQIHQFL